MHPIKTVFSLVGGRWANQRFETRGDATGLNTDGRGKEPENNLVLSERDSKLTASRKMWTSEIL